MSKKFRTRKVARHKRRHQTAVPRVMPPARRPYDAAQELLATWLMTYRARDVYVALLTSDLWPPHIAARIGHAYAYATLASIDASCFASTRGMDTYADLTQFLTELHRRIPSFAQLEDHVPASDWGEVKSMVRGDPVKMFYGGTWDYASDYIEAFRLARGTDDLAMRDLDHALFLQDTFLSLLDRPDIVETAGGGADTPPLPSESFWRACQAIVPALVRTTAAFALSPPLSARQGERAMIWPLEAFEDAVITAAALPYVLLDLDGEAVPLAPRDAAITVIHHWTRHAMPNLRRLERRTSAALATYMAQRVRHIAPGPFRIALRDGSGRTIEVPAIFRDQHTTWIVAVMSADYVAGFGEIEQTLLALFGQDGAILAMDVVRNTVVAFGNDAGPEIDPTSTRFLVVSAQETLDPEPIAFHARQARLFLLPEWTAIVDAVSGIEELLAYFAFMDRYREHLIFGFTGAVDGFAAFRQSHGLLVDGASTPELIMLDPHWGSNWRFDELARFWKTAPARFPNDQPTTWTVEPSGSQGRLLCLKARAAWILDWAAELPLASVHFLLDADAQALSLEDGHLLETFIHMLGDSMAQRHALLPPGLLRGRIVTHCLARASSPPCGMEDEAARMQEPLLEAWEVLQQSEGSLVLQVHVNLERAGRGFHDAQDARFEAESLLAWITGASAWLGGSLADDDTQCLQDSGGRPPRFTMRALPRIADVPDIVHPVVPTPAQYKAARRDLAQVLQASGVAPGRFELAAAKEIIDPARRVYRTQIHRMIAQFARTPVVLFAIEQFDALLAQYDRRRQRIQLSLAHEVDFDRERDLAEAHESFIASARNYRYLLEAALSSPEEGNMVPTDQDMIELVAHIDWLMVLYQASDTLHNAMDVGGIELNDAYVPEVFYAADRIEDFGLEMAADLLVTGSNEDTISSLSTDELTRLNGAMQEDAGFTLTQLLQSLELLYRWVSVSGNLEEMSLSYRTTSASLCAKLVEVVPDLDAPTAERVIEFLTLAPGRIRQLAGRDELEQDVPVWEHRKRVQRYAIRPLVRLDNGNLAWGAAAAHRAHGIWAGSLSDGYPPADLPWTHVDVVALAIKRRIEKELETRAAEICSRHSIYVLSGVNFRKRFPREGYDEVGDYDVLAYWPERNLWVTVECKYNKPAFSLKDARRLRDYIFGDNPSDGHVGKVVRRRAFLEANLDRLRTLLAWPQPGEDSPTIKDLYVCPRVFYWMRSPPYPVELEFVRLGRLDEWLTSALAPP